MSTSNPKKYGNDFAWCYIEEPDTSGLIAIWKTLGPGQEDVIGYASDKYNAQLLVDALISHENTISNDKQLTKREVTFLQFVSAHCPEPWATKANNAIMWNDREAFNLIKESFSKIY